MPELDIVRVPQILLPAPAVDLHKWSVIACDQFTSQPEYWESVEATVGDSPSTLRMVMPEAQLNAPDVEARIAAIQQTMRDYTDQNLLETHEAIVYVERELGHGTRRGLVVELDLEAYDYSSPSDALVRSTEGTALDRLPPRMDVRRGALLELPHILVLYDDPAGTVLTETLARRDELPIAYDLELMEGSGHLTGRFIADAALQQSVFSAIAALIEPTAYTERYGLPAEHPILFAMGDGNHSLAAAKRIWEELKAAGAPADDPARWALVELVNLHDESMNFEPIHRVVFGSDDLVRDFVDEFGASTAPVAGIPEIMAAISEGDAQRIGVVTAREDLVVEIPSPEHELPVATLQEFLDRWLAENPDAEIDYVHGEDVTGELSRRDGNAGFLLPGIGKDAFFRSIAVDGAVPRKTFSIGHAEDKRFYMECRAIR
ncbi:MAG TPA: DUF1015 domain-containing protein [Actinomycetaceae bacterium]|nr:DUF1015 domain-containing protein [Actinomycetaceae bacterium]